MTFEKKTLTREMQIITMFSICQFVTGQLARFNENDLVDPSFLDSLKMAQSVFDQESSIRVHHFHKNK